MYSDKNDPVLFQVMVSNGCEDVEFFDESKKILFVVHVLSYFL